MYMGLPIRLGFLVAAMSGTAWAQETILAPASDFDGIRGYTYLKVTNTGSSTNTITISFYTDNGETQLITAPARPLGANSELYGVLGYSVGDMRTRLSLGGGIRTRAAPFTFQAEGRLDVFNDSYSSFSEPGLRLSIAYSPDGSPWSLETGIDGNFSLSGSSSNFAGFATAAYETDSGIVPFLSVAFPASGPRLSIGATIAVGSFARRFDEH